MSHFSSMREGDLTTNENGYKDNTVLEKLVYVHEGVGKDRPKGGRNRLTNPHYFAGGYPGPEKTKCWQKRSMNTWTGHMNWKSEEDLSECRWRRLDQRPQGQAPGSDLCTG